MMKGSVHMSSINDFEFYNSGWDKNRWELNYKGEDKDMVIPEELIAEAEGNFTVAVSAENRNDIESISIPKNVPNIWLGTLYGARSLKNITVDPENPYLKDVDGVLYTKDGKTLIKAPCQKEGKYIVPEGVEKIETGAFQNSHLEEVILPKSLNEIGYSAFQYSSLKKMTVPEGVTKIEDSVFCDCTQLEEFEFLGNVDINYMHMDMNPEMEGRIAKESFTSPAECYILACLKVYPDIDKCRKRFIAATKRGKREKILEYLLKDMPEKKAEKGTYELNDTGDGEAEIKSYIGEESLIEIPSEIDGRKITAIGEGAFKNNEYIEKVIIPEGITSIGKSAFAGCISLEEAVLPESCISIGRSAFEECKALRTINLPQGMTVLERKVFKNCVSLEKLELPEKIVKIDDEALRNCSSINELKLPEGLVYLGKECLYACGFNYGPILDGEWGYSKRKFYIPASVTQIDDSGEGIFACYPKAKELFGVFEYKVILQVKKGSTAHRYASKKKIRFELV